MVGAGDSRLWGEPGTGNAAVLELLPCGSEGAGLRPCWGELGGCAGWMLLCVLPLPSQPPNLLSLNVFLFAVRGEGGRGKEEPNGNVVGRFLSFPVTLIPWLPMGLARLFKKVIGIKGARAAAACWRGRD